MFAVNIFDIHLVTEEEEAHLRRLAERDSARPLRRPALIGHVGGEPAAAISLADGRIVADPHRRTDHLLACLRLRAAALRAYDATPSLRARLLAVFSPSNHASSNGAGKPASERRSATEGTTGNGRAGQPPVRHRELAPS